MITGKLERDTEGLQHQLLCIRCISGLFLFYNCFRAVVRSKMPFCIHADVKDPDNFSHIVG